ncbi:hypothetical protein CIG75_09535 [Tumebacillus algifaecis]|uniref:Cupin type-2 domain-containing protein n=1 Tax=Tumebacillus algifaecis TaxID=1214604 RepID=A0A223D0B7_9BACL|nr:cupin domain-containing protein [Tumebacillus algifaecis]ASS75199.1 hypothetical protein CIG75_09535 [Tumebacillus algifaecis]
MSNELEAKKGTHYTLIDAGPFTELGKYKFEVGPYQFPGKLFLNELLGLTGMEVSFGKMFPGTGLPYSHKHVENEELYIFIKGQGQFLIDGEVIDVREGTAIRVGTEGVRTWRNNSTEELHYIVIQAKQGSLGQYTLQDGKIVEPKVTWPGEEA